MSRDHWALSSYLIQPCPFHFSLVKCPLCFTKPCFPNNNSQSRENQSFSIPCSNFYNAKPQLSEPMRLNKFESVAKNRCPKYVNEQNFKETKEINLDDISECNATKASVEYTQIDDEKMSCRYRQLGDRRVVSNIEISTLDNEKTNALIDTGATISVVSREFLNTISNSVHRVKPCPSFSVVLSIESNSKFNVTEQAEICFHLNEHTILWRFFVVPSLTNNIVLGMDFLSEYAVNIHCDPFKVELCKPPRKSKTQTKPFSKETDYHSTLANSESAWDTNFSFPNPATKPWTDSTLYSTTTLKSCINRTARVQTRTILNPIS